MNFREKDIEMNSTITQVKKEFSKRGLSSTYLPSEESLRIDSFGDLREQCVEMAEIEAEKYLRRCLSALTLDIETLTVNKGLICLTVVGFSPVEVRHHLRKSALHSVSKATKECLEIEASNFDISLKERMKENQATAIDDFKKAFKVCVDRGLLAKGNSFHKEFDRHTGNLSFFLKI